MSLESAVKQAGSGDTRRSSESPSSGNTKVPLKLIVQVGGEASSMTEDRNSNQRDWKISSIFQFVKSEETPKKTRSL